MKRSRLCAMMLAAASAVLGTAESRSASLDIPAGHPRLWFGNPERLAAARAYHATHPINPAGDMYMRALRGVLTSNADDCGMASRYLMGYQLTPARNDSFRDPIRQLGEQLISIYDWCHGSFTPHERAILVARWNGYIDYDNADPFANEGSEGNNYWWGRTRNSLLWGIATHGENPSAQALIDHALDVRVGRWLDRWYRQFGRGGVFIEGTDYGTATLAYPLVAFATAADFGYDPLARTPYFRDAIYATWYGTTPGATTTEGGTGTRPALFPFGDDANFLSGGVIQVRTYLGDFMTMMGIRGSPLANSRHARHWLTNTGTGRGYLFDSVRPSDPGSADGLPLDYYAPGAQVFDLRSGHAPAGTHVHLQLGTPGGSQHSHTDAGSFQIWRKGRWISRESAAYSKQFRGLEGVGTVDSSDPVAHNTLLFEGRSTGRWIGEGIRIIPAGLPRQDNPDGLPNVIRLHHHPSFGFAAVELSDAYRNRDGRRVDWPYADRAVREFLFVRDLELLLILDRMRGSSDSLMPYYRSPSWSNPYGGTGATHPAPQRDAGAVRRTFVTHFERQPTVIGNRVEAVHGTQRAELVTLLPHAPTFRVVDENLNDTGTRFGQHRVELDSVGQVESYFLNIVYGRDLGAAPLQASIFDEGSQWRIALIRPDLDRRATIVLRKGMSSAGGTVSIDDLPAVPLLHYVQAISITDGGPVWGPDDILLADGFE